MNSTWLPDRPSRNILIDVLGSENPGEVVAIGGHVDSWDIAEGAMGKFLNYQIIKRRPVFL
jgi:carboxypeptidase Q